MNGIETYDLVFSICFVLFVVLVAIVLYKVFTFFKHLDKRLKKVEHHVALENQLDS